MNHWVPKRPLLIPLYETWDYMLDDAMCFLIVNVIGDNPKEYVCSDSS